MSEEHHEESFIKTPKQLIWVIVLAFAIPIAIITLLTKFVGAGSTPSAGVDAQSPEAIEARIRPIAGFKLAAAGGDAAAARAGKDVYAAQCSACHASGAAGAPKFGDKAAWAPRIGQGYEALLHSALKGKGAMAPQGGGEFSDLEVGRALVYMVNEAGGSLPEPKATAAKAEAAATPAAAPAEAARPAAAAPVAAAKSEAEMINQSAGAPAAAGAAAGAAVAAAAGASEADGKALYNGTCMVCHASGVAGAPKVGDAAAWAPRIATGIDALVAAAIHGKGAMPPKGGKMDASDAQIRAAIDYMVSQSK